MLIVAVVFAVVGGLALGSFLSLVADRLPLGESIVSPPSHCGVCGHPIRPYDNLPVVSWLILRGRCRDCGAPIPARYPIVEASTGVLFGAIVGARYPDLTAIVLGLVLTSFLVPLTLIDLATRRLPNRLVAPAAAAAVLIGSVLDPGSEVERLIAGAAAGGSFLLVALAYPGGMGLGDVKLAGALGLFLGSEVAVAIFAALLMGVTVGVGIMARKGVAAGRKTGVPFGPFLAAGAVLAILAGHAILHAYLGGF